MTRKACGEDCCGAPPSKPSGPLAGSQFLQLGVNFKVMPLCLNPLPKKKGLYFSTPGNHLAMIVLVGFYVILMFCLFKLLEQESGCLGRVPAYSSICVHPLTHNPRAQPLTAPQTQSLCLLSRIPRHPSPLHLLTASDWLYVSSTPTPLHSHPQSPKQTKKESAKLLACTKGLLPLRGALSAPNFS